MKLGKCGVSNLSAEEFEDSLGRFASQIMLFWEHEE
jgi:hypothetical protein